MINTAPVITFDFIDYMSGENREDPFSFFNKVECFQIHEVFTAGKYILGYDIFPGVKETCHFYDVKQFVLEHHALHFWRVRRYSVF